jgi:hypothetical protein
MNKKELYLLRFAILFIGVLCLFSCTKEIPFDSQASTPKIVINSLFTTDSVWSAHISRSRNITEGTSDYGLSDATVSVYDENGTLVTSLEHQEEGYYVSPSLAVPQANQNYRIEASASGFESVDATNYIPIEVPILQIDTVSNYNDEGELIMQITLNFNDPSGTDNYYIVETVVKGSYFDPEIGDSAEFAVPMILTSSDPNIESINRVGIGGQNFGFEYLMLRDNAFSGQSYALTFSVRNYEDVKDLELIGEIKLVNTSKEYFDYLSSFLRYQRTQGNPFSTPVQVFSNVNNGMGIFAGGTINSWEIQF